MRLWELLDTKGADAKKPLGESTKKPLDFKAIENRLLIKSPKGPIKDR